MHTVLSNYMVFPLRADPHKKAVESSLCAPNYASEKKLSQRPYKLGMTSQNMKVAENDYVGQEQMYCDAGLLEVNHCCCHTVEHKHSGTTLC